jgi:hypothetical protein
METLGRFELDIIPTAAMDRLRRQVGVWSKANFGDNLTQTFPTFTIDADGPEGAMVQVPFIAVALGSMAPLMGMVEELGELAIAKDETEELDALGDCGIYLCDYVDREQLTFQGCFAGLEEYWTNRTRVNAPIAEIGKLYHCHLKKIQGIRGMDDPARFREFQKLQVASTLISLCSLSKKVHTVRFEDVVSATWERVVRKRNWKAHKKDGDAENTEN